MPTNNAMRLLKRNPDGSLEFTRDLSSEIPPHAILSHTWGPDDQEVTFHDIENRRGQDKDGFKKLTFCGDQAAADGLEHFWIDTSCINKTNSTELSTAIRSMFRWYRDASKCYVYLTDVSCKDEEHLHSASWKTEFRRSRWMTRGWTLQELIAPSSVEFFSKEGIRLGDKRSLENLLHEITGVSVDALRGKPLAEFGIEERLSWLEKRSTKLPEDRAYCMFGIFGIHLPVLYGEGEAEAFFRLHKRIGKQPPLPGTRRRCIADLCVTNPRDDKTRIEDIKGGLLADSYTWVLDNPDFRKWLDNKSERLLWVKGDPGKGKTMLLCGIIDEIEAKIENKQLLAYFYFQATDERIDSAIAAVRSLIMMLLEQDGALLSHIEKKYEIHGRALFEDANAWHALYKVLLDMLRAPRLAEVFLVVDALDECLNGLPGLLNLIVETSKPGYHVKWLVSSRNWTEIEERLGSVAHRLSLEVNTSLVAAAVRSYISYKVSQLTERKRYNKKVADQLYEYLSSNADGTFLWVALICQELEKAPRHKALEKAQSSPASLDELYEQMMRLLQASEDSALCTKVLAVAATAYVPLVLEEFAALIDECRKMLDDSELLRDVVAACRSFLTIRDNTVYFVHQSAKDFLVNKKEAVLFPDTKYAVHGQMFATSVAAMCDVLRRDMYDLGKPGAHVDSFLVPSNNPLLGVEYSCINWIRHFIESNREADKNSEATQQRYQSADRFLRTKCLYWFEALSLLGMLFKGMSALQELAEHQSSTQLMEIAREAYRLLQHFRVTIQQWPLQTYVSVLIFSPAKSLLRRLFHHERPSWVECRVGVEDHWSTREMTLESQDDLVSASFSPDGRRLLSVSKKHEVNIWNATTGVLEMTIEGVSTASFSSDGGRVASAGYCSVSLLKASSGACERKLQSQLEYAHLVSFSADSSHIAVAGAASGERHVEIWDASRGTCVATLPCQSHDTTAASFSADGHCIRVGDDEGTVRKWDITTTTCLSTRLVPTGGSMKVLCFSTDAQQVILASKPSLTSEESPGWLDVRDASEGTRIVHLHGHDSHVLCAAFSADNRRIVSGTRDGIIKIWNATTGECQSTLNAGPILVRSCAFSPDNRRIISGHPYTIHIWDASAHSNCSAPAGHKDMIRSIAFSADGQHVVSTSIDGTAKLWGTASGTCLATLAGHTNQTFSAAFSPNGQHVVTCSQSAVRIWNRASGACESSWNADSTAAVFSIDGQHIISANNHGICKLWNVASASCLDMRAVQGGMNLFEQALGKQRIGARQDKTPAAANLLGDWHLYLGPSPPPRHRDILHHGRWLSTESEVLIRLPKHLLPLRFATFHSEAATDVAVGTRSGRICLLHFSSAIFGE
ncbi:beta transducin-like protein HET-E2C*40 [Microdochium trichocladiopsis]|uniref:Beta transducin-like protein HET-E2C*40 n=1 Tax=Microdochium trichocladiopsis TaxID=1682393 RepID=A0A9P9BLG6_9PEZI|nr:beta transducin-like protein HET-E2C*40 [Microdochium trichocladiopsis]KAH7024897.1 beta transducin-like protein HET-E2C*40 [Microdochium trichocladiopsis]